MNNIDKILCDEINYNLQILNKKQLSYNELPKGYIEVKKGEYYYLKYRSGDHVISKYIGKFEQAKQVVEKVNKRKKIKEEIKEIKIKLTRLYKMKKVKE